MWGFFLLPQEDNERLPQNSQQSFEVLRALGLTRASTGLQMQKQTQVLLQLRSVFFVLIRKAKNTHQKTQ